MVIQTESFVSPIKWHLAHTSWFFENFILKKIKEYKIFDKSFDYMFNSYYYAVGNFNRKDLRGYLNRPEISKIFEYREYVEKNIYELFLKKNVTEKKKNFLLIGINHEQQHQELILMDILNVFFNNPLKPSFAKKKNKKIIKRKGLKYWRSEDTIDFKYGANSKNEFAYDNEFPAGEKVLLPFEIEYDFVSNNEWREFMECDGYKRPELWLSDGWDFIKKNNINFSTIGKPLRLILTGNKDAPPISEIFYILNKQEVIRRLDFFD